MGIKLSKKQGGEVATKGFVFDLLDERDYVTKDYLENVFAPKFKKEIVDEITTEFRKQVTVLMEDNSDKIRMLIEAFQNRFERIERHVGLLNA